MIETLLLLGATGDLAQRFLLPAVGALHESARLPEGFRIVGAARGALDAAAAQRLAGESVPPGMFAYRAVDLADPSSLASLLDGAGEPIAAYLALPPSLVMTTIESLVGAGLPDGSRVVVEKPFGHDCDSARELNALIARTGIDAYRVDHVLGMETVQGLVATRCANPFLERIWNGGTVEQVEILWEETLALEGRAGYYDQAGALKDVLQNHMLQLLALVAMDPAAGGDLHRPKLDVLTSARVQSSRRARYTAGTLADGRDVGDYARENGVDPARCTETFAEVVVELEDSRWDGTRFVLRTGKALPRRRKLVLLRFRGGGELEVGVDGPTDVVLRLAGPLELCAAAAGDRLPPYAHVLLDILGGTNVLSVSGDGAEEAWRVVAPVLSAWQAGDVPLEEYPAGGVVRAVAGA
jgi:glucose-6-phosphate 1-dehydrogenase